MFLKITSIPSGLSNSETRSVVASATLPLTLDASSLDLPYHLLQKASLYFLDLSFYGIRAPSLILGLAAGLSIFILMQRLFKKSVAIIAAIIAISISQFLIPARAGDPSIMLIFWPILTLLQAALISQQVKFSGVLRVTLGLTIILSLYTPFMIYLLLSLAISAIIHPHLRYVLKNYDPAQVAISLLMAVVLLIPLGWGIYNDPSLAWQLAGFPANLPDLNQYLSNALLLLNNMFGFTNRDSAEILRPAYSIGVCVIILFGFIRLFRDFHSARSHLLLVWLALIIPALTSNPGQLYVLYVPLILLLAVGLEALIREWYKLFPLNPYARIAALLPLSLLMLSIISFNYSRYFYSYAYSHAASSSFSHDLLLIKQHLGEATIKTNPVLLVVKADQIPVYDLLRRDNPALTITSAKNLNPNLTQSKIIVSTTETVPTETIKSLGVADAVIVDDSASNALRFKVFHR